MEPKKEKMSTEDFYPLANQRNVFANYTNIPANYTNVYAISPPSPAVIRRESYNKSNKFMHDIRS